ncbi:hypothetical protein BKA93DRAFT_822484 [Sparassis latifolia]
MKRSAPSPPLAASSLKKTRGTSNNLDGRPAEGMASGDDAQIFAETILDTASGLSLSNVESSSGALNKSLHNNNAEVGSSDDMSSGDQASSEESLAGLTIVDDPFTAKQHEVWDAAVMEVVHNEVLEPEILHVSAAATLLEAILGHIEVYIKPAYRRNRDNILKEIREHAVSLLPALKYVLRERKFSVIRCLGNFRIQPTPVFSYTSATPEVPSE